MRSVRVISSGSELISGRKTDTNSSVISRELYATDFRVRDHVTVSDNPGDLERTIREALDKYDTVIMTGGLGPTEDDRTVVTAAEIFQTGIVTDKGALESLRRFLVSVGREPDVEGNRMADVPAGSYVLKNDAGMAPGFLIERSGKIFAAMPGVPHEMEAMLKRRLIPYLEEKYGLKRRKALELRLCGLTEREIDNKIVAMKSVSDDIIWGITAESGVCTLSFLSQKGSDIDSESIYDEASANFGIDMLLRESESPQMEAVNLLRRHGLQLSVAESCTGGLISSRITDIPGASAVFNGGAVTYSNASKIEVLGVPAGTVESYGAVSSETAEAMAVRARSVFGADIALSVTGIAGPGGGTQDKPVGTVWFGFHAGGKAETFQRLFSGSRDRVRERSAVTAVDYLRRYLRRL